MADLEYTVEDGIGTIGGAARALGAAVRGLHPAGLVPGDGGWAHATQRRPWRRSRERRAPRFEGR